ncbi:1-phosphofructokinase family hexose kinase [Gemella sp. GH3]|uniref:1-phosphofructokinase family hexose kinase n=1 Tax=unclassified Gemella TaxID=2624949 RepID=UPI0015CFC27B|nr:MULTISPECIES: 1-phosphofructokinase family hexose kinase [unclassified Gemella]MBF0713602.1 1-phosphofructokinase family hexose kinase [Gemella sp. GH3.1]NYS50554.1 1-phosphofructokinase family hexose kinase [Gemella sp. GH3]
MYYTVTLNPAVDMLTKSNNFSLGKLNRTEEAVYVVGGKGINISMLLKNVEKDTVALGFIAGFTGQYIKEELKKLNVVTNFVETKGNTRINIKLTTDTETEINGQSSTVTKEDIAEFHKTLGSLTEEDTVFLSGNIISGMTTSDFVHIAEEVTKKGATLVVDSNKDLVLETLKYRPFVVKPNEFELGEMFGVEINGIEDILLYAKKLQDLGARNVLVSRGGDGALLITEEGEVFSVGVTKGDVVSTVAAGDSMLAMFVSRYDDTKDYKEALKYASAAGGATSFFVGVGSKDLINQLVTQLKIQKIK